MNCQTFSPFDKLRRVEFGAFGRQRDEGDITRHDELVGHVPARLIDEHDRVGTGCDGERYLGKMEGHGFGIAEGQYQPRTFAEFRADRPEDVDRFCPLILGG